MTEGLLYDPCILKTILFALPFADALQIRQLSRFLDVRVRNQHDWWLQKTGQLAIFYLSMVNRAREMYNKQLHLFHLQQITKNENFYINQKYTIRDATTDLAKLEKEISTCNKGQVRLLKEKIKRRRLSVEKAELYKQCYEHNIKKLKKLTKN